MKVRMRRTFCRWWFRIPGLVLVCVLISAGCSGSSESTPETVDSGSGLHIPATWLDSGNRSGDSTVTKPDVEVPDGYLEFCLSDTDCESYGLQCYSSGPSDTSPICSSGCDSASDCPENMICKNKGETKICQVAGYCDTCQTDSQCGGGEFRCVTDKNGSKFCSQRCVLDDLDGCGAGNYCKKMGLALEDYFCMPMFGACKGNGTHCKPCQSDDDCLKGLVCHENSYTHEKYCAQICEEALDCPKDFGCYEIVGEEQLLCTLEIEGSATETCYKGNKNFCDPCMYDYECLSGACYNYSIENKFFCTFACEPEHEGWEDGCPSGLFCAPNFSETSGVPEVCIPPTAWGCQGFLNCLGVECIKGEKCADGFCQPK